MRTLILQLKMKIIHKWANQFGLTLVKLIEVDGTMYIKDNKGKLWAIGREKSQRQTKNKTKAVPLPQAISRTKR